MEAYGFSVINCQDDIGIAGCCLYKRQFIIFAQRNRNLAVGTDIFKLFNTDPFDKTLSCRKEQTSCGIFLGIRNDGTNLFFLFQLQQINDRNAFRSSSIFRHIESAQTEYPSLIGEEQDKVMRRHADKLINDIILIEGHALDAFAAAVLHFIGRTWNPLDIAVFREGDDDIIHRNEIFIFHICDRIDDFRLSRIAILVFNDKQFLFEDGFHTTVVSKNIFQIINLDQQFLIFILNLFPFQTRQSSELHIENCLGLNFR